MKLGITNNKHIQFLNFLQSKNFRAGPFCLLVPSEDSSVVSCHQLEITEAKDVGSSLSSLLQVLRVSTSLRVITDNDIVIIFLTIT